MFKLTLVTPEKKLLEDKDVEEVFVPAHRGELNILPGHASLMTTLSTGILKYKLKDSDQLNYASISWGYCEVFPGGVNVLAETAEIPDEIDIERVLAAKKKSEELLTSGDMDMIEIEKFQRKYQRSLVREETKKLTE